jgi:hypothetical protein
LVSKLTDLRPHGSRAVQALLEGLAGAVRVVRLPAYAPLSDC